jgi:hypothetical protein
MMTICLLCAGTGFVACDNDEEGWRPPNSDSEPADECPECAGYGFVTADDCEIPTSSTLSSHHQAQGE